MTDYDSSWEEALALYFQPFLALFFPAAHAEIDWSRGCQSLDQELRQIVREAALGGRRVDHLVKVWLNSGQEQWVLVHVEVQTSRDPGFARRMYTYNYRLFDRYNREVVTRDKEGKFLRREMTTLDALRMFFWDDLPAPKEEEPPKIEPQMKLTGFDAEEDADEEEDEDEE
jgi:hypothetical protein